MSKSNIINFTNIDDVNSGYQNTSGWFKKLHTKNSASNREVDRHPILRLKNVDDLNTIQGVIRFNDEKSGGAAFEGYDGIKWNTFSTTPGSDGKDGLNYRTVVTGQNLFDVGDNNYFPLFKDITTTITQNDTSVEDNSSGTDSQISSNINTVPTFKYDSSVDNKKFNLANHNIIYEPYDESSYKVFVNENECWPPVDYTNHTKYSTSNNGVQLGSNNYFLYNLPSKFKFYDTTYNEVYVNENGYITFGIGESAFVQNLLQNHFARNRISALFLNLIKNTGGTTSTGWEGTNSDIFTGTGRYGEIVITYQNYIHNPATVNYRVDFQIRLFLSTTTDTNNLYSDDNFKEGTIQISYNNNTGMDNLSPIVGLSNGLGYNSSSFTELYFSNLKTNTDWNELNGTGVPYLRSLVVLNNFTGSTPTGWTSSTVDAIVRIKKAFTDLQLGTDSILGDETIDSTVYTTYKNDSYYIKILDLGTINEFDSIALAIKSIFDYPEKRNDSSLGDDVVDPNDYNSDKDLFYYSDSVNYFYDFETYKYTNSLGNHKPGLDENWTTIPQSKFLDISSLFNTTTVKTKDYMNIFDNLNTNTDYKTELHNSKIYRIQAKYENCLKSDFTMEKRLFIKIIYSLNSDVSSNTSTGITSAISLPFLRTPGGDNYGPYNYIENSTHYFAISRTGLALGANFNIQIYDYTFTVTNQQLGSVTNDNLTELADVNINLRANYNKSLTLELLDSQGNTLETSNNTDTKVAATVGGQSTTLFNFIQKQSPSNSQFYIKITGTHNLGKYGISLFEPEVSSSNTQISALFANHKFTQINADDLPLTTTSATLTSNERAYSITKSNDMLFMVSDTSGDYMKIYNYTFAGAIKTDYPITTAIAKNVEVYDLQFMGEKLLIAYKNSTNLDLIVYDGTTLSNERARIESISPIFTHIRVLNEYVQASESSAVSNKNHVVLISLKDDYKLSLNCISEDSFTSHATNFDSFTNTSISGTTDTVIMHQIVNVIILKNNIDNYAYSTDNSNQGKHNILIVGNNVVTNTSIIVKLSLDTTTQEYSLVGTQSISTGVSGEKITSIFAEPIRATGDDYDKIVVMFKKESSGVKNYVLRIYDNSLTESTYVTVAYSSVALDFSTTTIINMKVINSTLSANASRIIIMWYDSSNTNRYYLVYDYTTTFAVKKSDEIADSDRLMDISGQMININGNREFVYTILKRNSSITDAFKLKLSVVKEAEAGSLIDFLSTKDYLDQVDFNYAYASSIFNKTSDISFLLSNKSYQLIKNPDPITVGQNDENLFYFGFDNSEGTKKFILEGFGKLTNVATNTGETITANFTMKTVTDSLSFRDISLLFSSTDDVTTFAYDGQYSSGESRLDVFDINADGLDKNNFHYSYYSSYNPPGYQQFRRFNTSMAVFSNTSGSTTSYYTGVLYGPTAITGNNTESSSTSDFDTHKQKYTYKFDIHTNGVYKSQNAFQIQTSGGHIYNPFSDLLDIIPITDGFIIIQFLAEDYTTYGGFTDQKIILNKYTLSGDTFTSSTQNINMNLEEYYYTIHDAPIFKIRKIDNDTQILIIARQKGAADPMSMYSSGSRDYRFIFIKIEDLTFSINDGSESNKFLNVGSASNFHDYTNTSGFSYMESNPSKFTGLVDFIHFNHDSKNLIYIFDYAFFYGNVHFTGSNGASANQGISVCKLEQAGDNGTNNGNEIYGSNYIGIESGGKDPEKKYLQTAVTNFVGDYSSSRSVGDFINFFHKNVYFNDSGTFYIYFMAKYNNDYYNDDGTYKSISPGAGYYDWNSVSLGTSLISYDLKYTHARITRVKIVYNATFASETMEIETAYTFDDSTATDAQKEAETLYTRNANLSQFDMVMDGSSNTRYIIASSNGQLYKNTATGSEYVDVKIERDKIDFIIYKIGSAGALTLLCYGRSQSIHALNIENDNLLIFSTADSSGSFSAGGQFIKVFKLPVGDIEAASDKQIVMNTTTFATAEPTSDTDNTLHYPHVLMNVNEKSKFVYSGATSTRTANASQTVDLPYNMVVGYGETSSNSGYSAAKKIGIQMFGDFTASSSSGGESSGGSSEESTSTAVVTTIGQKIQYFFNQSGNESNSNFIIGRFKNTTYTTGEDDIGTTFYSYLASLILTTDSNNFYVRTNSIPNYEPIYSGEIIKGVWSNELSDTTYSDYSIMPQNYGWLSADNSENGTYLKIPHSITTVNSKTVLIGDNTITETFWFIGDTDWDAIMVNPGYSVSTASISSTGYYVTNTSLVSSTVNDKLLTPAGRIGVATNGTLIYNYSNLERTKNAVSEIKSDIFGGMGDADHAYHYHQWPINLEGMLDLGHPNTSVAIRSTPTLSTSYVLSGSSKTFPNLIYGMTYYFNQIDVSNYDSSTVDKFSLKYEPIYKGTVYRFKVKQVNDEYYLSPLDFAKNYTSLDGSSNPIWTRRDVISKLKPGDTVIFHQDEFITGDDNSSTRPIIITNTLSTPSTGVSEFALYSTINTDTSQIGTSTLSVTGTVGTDGMTTFNVPYNFDVAVARYQPSFNLGGSNLLLADTAFNTTDNEITVNNHGFITGQAIIFTTLDTTKTIGSLNSGTTYYIKREDDNKFKLSTSITNSISGTVIDFGTVAEGSYIIRPITIIITDSIVSTDTITLTNHGFSTGDSLIYDYPASALSSYSGSVAQNTELYVIKIDNDTFKFAESEANALAGTQTTIYPNTATNYFFRLTNSINRDRGSFLNTGSFSEYHVGVLNTGETTRLYKLVSEDKIIVSLSSINETNDTINISGHGLNTGDKLLYMRAWVNGNSIQYGGSNILEGQTIYYAIRVDADNIKLATSLAYAQAGTNLDLSVKETSNDDNFGFLRLNNDLGTSTASPVFANKSFGDIIYFNQQLLPNKYSLKIKSVNEDGSGDLDSTNGTQVSDIITGGTDTTEGAPTVAHTFETITSGGLYFVPNNTFSTSSSTTVFFNAGSSVTELVSGSSQNMTVTGGSIKNGLYSRPTEYNFENTLIRHGAAGNSYCPYTKFTIPNFSEIKINYLTMKYSSTTSKFEIYGTLNTDYYSQSTSNLLTELKLFIDTRYIITLDASVQTASKVPKFSPSNSSWTEYKFDYKFEETFNHDTSNNLLTFTVGELVSNLYLYNSSSTSDGSGSTYDGKITGLRTYDLIDKIRFTDLNTDVTADSGSNLNEQEFLPNKVYVKVDGSVYKFYASTTTGLDYYAYHTTNEITTLNLYNNTKYEFDVSHSSMSGKQLKFSSHSTDYTTNNITFSSTYDDTVTNKVTFVVSGLANSTTIYAYDGADTSDTTIKGTTTIKTVNAKPINIFTKVSSTKLEFYKNPTTYFNGYLDYENASLYLDYKLAQTGPTGHSPLLGFAFDGFPIYGPIGYDKEDDTYGQKDGSGNNLSNYVVKLLKSSYTGGNDSEGNPKYIQGSGDLDFCNGINSITPEFPEGIFHYVCTIELNSSGGYLTSINGNYGYLNDSASIVNPAYPYIIGAYKGVPDRSNFNLTTTTTTTTNSTSDQTTTYQINFKSLKTKDNNFNGASFNAIEISQDDNYLNLRPNPHPYIWNFTNSLSEDGFFGKDNKYYTNDITTLKSLDTDTKFKAYGSISKWICKEDITKGLAVRLTNSGTTDSSGVITTPRLEVELYNSITTVNESQSGAAFLGIALNDAVAGTACYVCTKGITTIKLGNSSSGLRCGSYGILMFADQSGYITSVPDSIINNTYVAGYFLEEKPDSVTLTKNSLVLFNVQGSFNF